MSGVYCDVKQGCVVLYAPALIVAGAGASARAEPSERRAVMLSALLL
jgi:hypothetical protein